MGRVALLLVDECHMLTDPKRGPTLEAVISRMRTIAQGEQVAAMPIAKLRVLAASATVSNVEDIATWLGPHCKTKRFDESYRPVPLRWRVLTWPMAKTFTFDKLLIDRLLPVVREHAAGRPALVFCNSRKVCQLAAHGIGAQAGAMLVASHAQRERLHAAAARLSDRSLASIVRNGIGWHDASVELSDRRLIEELFAEGALSVLCCTAGLAQGINLPARLVVVMNTMHYSSAATGYEEYTRIEVMQMAGRAGRPQFDTEGVCVIMTRDGMKARYEQILNGTEMIESHMHEHLLTHLNAEIAFQAAYMSDLAVCVRWLKSTFFYTRVSRDPAHYSMSGDSDSQLKRLLMKSMRLLSEAGMIGFGEDLMSVQPLLLGTIMARFCVEFETMRSFPSIDSASTLECICTLVANATEFCEPLYLRHVRSATNPWGGHTRSEPHWLSPLPPVRHGSCVHSE